jgi:hypothetical protein
VFTIVKNERYFLPIWLKYYSRYFDSEDIYVLDHQSDDGSTSMISANVIKVENELAFDHRWLAETVSNFQKELLNEYECVIFSEADELLYSPKYDLNELIDVFLSSDDEFLTCFGYEIVQKIPEEINLNPGDEIFINRKYWDRHEVYDKPLISKISMDWVPGFHDCWDMRKNYNCDLHLIHLHRVDFELLMERHKERAQWKYKDDKLGYQNKTDNRDWLWDWFNWFKPKWEIPDDHRIRFIGI